MQSPQLTIAIQCHNFQRRLCWMLSSLAQQTKPGLVRVDVACMPGNGRPTTEEVVALFAGRIDIKPTVMSDFAEFQLRGLVRNRQLATCQTEWLMFGDSDMVYCPEYFERLVAELESKHARATYLLSTGRMSNLKDDAEKMVCEYVKDESRIVPEPFALAQRLLPRRMRNCGAGFSQIINMRHCPHGGYYVTPDENRDWDWTKRGSNPKSDMQFRRRVAERGGRRVALPEWFTAGAIHLNHDRDPEAGKHLDTQR